MIITNSPHALFSLSIFCNAYTIITDTEAEPGGGFVRVYPALAFKHHFSLLIRFVISEFDSITGKVEQLLEP